METPDNRVMEGSGRPDPGPPDQGTSLAMSGPRLSHPLEKLQSQRDSFLTAARLVRRGWAEEENAGGRVSSIRQPHLSKSDPERAEIGPTEPRGTRIRGSAQKTAEDTEASPEMNQTCKGAFSADRPTERRTGIVCFRVSGCRSTCRPSRRFKAPILPAIAEI